MGTLVSLSKAATTIALEISEWSLLIFGVVLTIGIVGEIKSAPWSVWLKTFEYLVLVGVLGEFLADGGIFLFSTHLQTIAEAEYSRLNKEAGDARKEAAKVDLRAAELEKEAVLLRTQLRTQESRAMLLMEPHSQELLVKIKSSHRQKITIGQCGRQDNEVTLSVMTLTMLLRAKGWDVNPWSPFFPCTTGMQLVVSRDAPNQTRTAADAIAEALVDIGVMPKGSRPVVAVGIDPPSADSILLIVQLHP